MAEKNKGQPAKLDWWAPIADSWIPGRYRKLIEAPLWPAIAAILLIGVIQYSFMVFQFVTQWPQTVDEVAVQWEKSFPKVTIKDGLASCSETKPVTGEIDIRGDKFRVIVDTTGTTKDINPTWTDAMLIASREFVIRQTQPQMKPMQERKQLSELTTRFGDIVIDANGIRELGQKMKPYYIGTLLFQGIVRFVMVKLAHIFIGSLVVLITSAIARKRERYSKLMRIACYALIPAAAFELLILFVSLIFPKTPYGLFFFPYLAVYIVYLVFGALSLEKQVNGATSK